MKEYFVYFLVLNLEIEIGKHQMYFYFEYLCFIYRSFFTLKHTEYFSDKM